MIGETLNVRSQVTSNTERNNSLSLKNKAQAL